MATHAAPSHEKVPVPWLSIAIIAAAVTLCLFVLAFVITLLSREAPRTPDDVSTEIVPEAADDTSGALEPEPLALPLPIPAAPTPTPAPLAAPVPDAAVDAPDAAATDAAFDAPDPDAAPSDAAPTEEPTPVALPEPGPPCGAIICPSGKVCCNASCGTCTNPGETCDQLVCGMPILPSSTPCGPNTCDIGEICCNPGCGICVRFGQTCDTQRRCLNEITYPQSQFCGMQTCNVGYVCCNPSCGICKRPGEPCRQDTCG